MDFSLENKQDSKVNDSFIYKGPRSRAQACKIQLLFAFGLLEAVLMLSWNLESPGSLGLPLWRGSSHCHCCLSHWDLCCPAVSAVSPLPLLSWGT